MTINGPVGDTSGGVTDDPRETYQESVIRQIKAEARREALEEAAKECESSMSILDLPTEPQYDRSTVRRTCLGLAAALRERAEKELGDEKT